MKRIRNSQSFIRTVAVTGASYIVFGYTEKPVHNIEKFCCLERVSLVFAIGTTFNLCGMWVTDTLHRNKRLINLVSGKHPVFLGPVMIHLTKDKTAF